MIILLVKAVKYIFKLPYFILYVLKDVYTYIKYKKYQHFNGFGIHVFTGKFGACKTSTVSHYAYELCYKYKNLQVLTNYKLQNFPPWTIILPLNNIDDILNCSNDTLILVDEIGTIFNSRDFSKGCSVPKILFQHICQCRKRHKMIYATSQRYSLVDKQLRDVATTVRTCKGHFKDPFTRITRVNTYDAEDYELLLQSLTAPVEPYHVDVFLQTDKTRKLYDTEELVNTMLKMEYLSDEEILRNRGEITSDVGVAYDNKQKRSVKRSIKRAI